MTRYRVMESPSPNGFYSIRGKYYLDQQVPCRPLKKVITYDEVTPNFKLRSAKGEVFNNPFSSTSFETTDVGGYVGTILDPDGSPYRIYNHQRFLGAQQFNLGSFAPVNLDVDNARAQCRIKALGNITATEVDLGNFIAEWDKTRLLHKNLGHALERLVREESLRYRRPSRKKVPLYDERGNPLLNRQGKPQYRWMHTPEEVSGKGAFGSKTKRLSDLYLAVRMGLLPLLSDLEGACKILSTKKYTRRTARGNFQASGTSQTSMVVPDPHYSGGWSMTFTHTKIITFRNGLLYEASPAGLVVGQLGLTRPLSSLWQSMPWSFVVDWFVGVGNWLDAIQPSGASRTLAAWDGYREINSYVITVGGSHNGSTTDGRSGNISWNETFMEVQTTKSRLPWDGSAPTVPVPGTGFSAMRSADFAALVLQRIGSII